MAERECTFFPYSWILCARKTRTDDVGFIKPERREKKLCNHWLKRFLTATVNFTKEKTLRKESFSNWWWEYIMERAQFYTASNE